MYVSYFSATFVWNTFPSVKHSVINASYDIEGKLRITKVCIMGVLRVFVALISFTCKFVTSSTLTLSSYIQCGVLPVRGQTARVC
jgi:hypothetical protein